MNITWLDLNHVDHPGTHALADGRGVKVDAKHIVQWQEDPAGAFEAFWHPGDRTREPQFTLTDFRPSRPAGAGSAEAA
jgi:hypothetical protein